VCCRRDPRAALAAMFDERDSQRGAFGRVGPRAQLVKQDERAVVADLDHIDDVLHVRGKSGQRLFDRLLVTDVGQHQIKGGNEASVVCRDMQSAFCHQGQKANGLERDGLAAGIGSGDDERVKITAQPNRDRHDGFAVNKRVSGPLELQFSVCSDLRLDGVHRKRELCARKNAVERDKYLKIAADVYLVIGRLGRELGEDALDLLFFGEEQFAQLVVGVDRLHGLDEEGSAGGGHVMHQTRYFIFKLASHRHHETIGADRHDRLLQILGIGRRGDDLLQGFADLGALLADLAADGGQLRARAVRDLVLGENGGKNLFLQKFVRGQLEKEAVQHSRQTVAIGIALDLSRAAQHARDAQQLLGTETAAAVGAFQRSTYITDPGQAGRTLECNQLAGCGGLHLPGADLRVIGQRLKRQAALLGIVTRRLFRQKGKHLVQFQFLQRFFI